MNELRTTIYLFMRYIILTNLAIFSQFLRKKHFEAFVLGVDLYNITKTKH